jgi:hypothetical protein
MDGEYWLRLHRGFFYAVPSIFWCYYMLLNISRDGVGIKQKVEQESGGRLVSLLVK